jgi:sensor histidine kinase YesM
VKRQKPWFQQPTVRVLSHLLFLSGCYLLLLQVFKTGNQVSMIDHIYTALFLLFLIPPVYLNLELLLPRLGKKKTLFAYGFLLITTIILFSWLNIRFFNDWSEKLLPDFLFISYYNWWEIVGFFTAIIVFTSLVKLSKASFLLQDLQQQLLLLEKEKVDMELASLRSQVNPHFFFNTLNSIYSLSLDKDDRLPATILQLSGIMRYYLYESKGEKVPLDKEISILKDYIELQRIRSADNLEVKLNLTGETDEIFISPLLLITIAENAFKHGAKGINDDPFIHVEILINGRHLKFKVENKKGKVDTDLQKEKGVGLDNVRRRLELLYPFKHQLQIHDTDNLFSVELNVEL